ncbi:MAG TPA: hypothetical protein VFB13_08590 [Reyranella sp.]|jgi:hypothetical protein|nr:hypothetical protein [Reyranella sp.]
MTKIHVLSHDQYDIGAPDYEKWVGVYSSRERAEQALARLRNKPGFRERPEAWEILEWELDKDHGWRDGYATIYRGEDYAKEGR